MRISARTSPQVCGAGDPSPVARASVRTVKDSSVLKLTVRTAEGDTVEISLQAQSLLRHERGYARGPEGRISQKSDSQSNRLTGSVNVTGDLSESELKDIQKLMGDLAGETPPGEPGTISDYQYSYQRTREVTQSTVQLYG
jgi:hypothetical protein